MYYPSSENKSADQLRGYHELICVFVFAYAERWFSHFRICRTLVFSRCGSNDKNMINNATFSQINIKHIYIYCNPAVSSGILRYSVVIRLTNIGSNLMKLFLSYENVPLRKECSFRYLVVIK